MLAISATFGATLLIPLSIWYNAVNRTVHDPYLDEIFHIPQSQLYCNGRFDHWDPMITTPPGLYLLSYLASPILGCSISALRLINVPCLFALFVVIYAGYVERRKSNNEVGFSSGLLAQHSALNAVLFPPLFFFSALYYTDVPSTLSVLVSYWYTLRSLRDSRAGFGHGCVQVLLGVASLSLRQTNIFWIAVAPIGLTVVVELDRGHPVVKQSMYKHADGFGDSMYSVIKTTWKMDVIYDPPVREASFEDFMCTTASIITRGLKALTQPSQLLRLLVALTPYLTLIALFISFVVWNGGVVLGDKASHVATLHAAQMLYIWPYVTFFSWPLLLPHLLIMPLMLISRLSEVAHLEPFLFFKRHYFLPRLSLLLGFTVLAALIVRFNTIVHPYALADNRHFTFYVLKRLLRPWWVRYAVTPVYVLCAWACVETRGEASVTAASTPATRDSANEKAAALQSAENSSVEADDDERRPLHLPDGKFSATTSFIIVSLATTVLQLCSAPLVEPRYFIIPWLMWRTHLPLHAADSPRGRPVARAETGWKAVLQSYDYRVVLETIWFLFLDFVICYVFLYRGFTWPSEPTKVQRFIW